jgi:hypothetical protein
MLRCRDVTMVVEWIVVGLALVFKQGLGLK